MTDYFEVRDHDSAARLGKLRLDDPITTPALVGDVLRDTYSRWTQADSDSSEEIEGSSDAVTVLPHRAMPSGTPDEIVKTASYTKEKYDFPTAEVVNVENPVASGRDVYILTGLRKGRARQVVDAVIGARRTLEPDSALVAPGIATPRNVALLAYLGVDGFDEDYTAVQGYGETYMTRDLSVDLDELTELPCSCEVCAGSSPDDLGREDVAKHNVSMLRAELATVRDRIRNGRLREYIEGQVRSERWLVEAMRLVDQERDYIETRTPVVRNTRLDANSSETLDRIEVKRFAERVVERYRAPRTDVGVLLPCSAGKPYSQSKSHQDFRQVIGRRGHEVIVTSPLGVVPRELENIYPAAHYDTPVTGRWDAKEREFVSSVFESYVENNPYDRLVAHLPEEGYGEIVRSVVESKDVEVEFTVKEDEHPRDDDPLERLGSALDGVEKSPHGILDKWNVRGVVDYQFGEDVFDSELGLSGVEIRGRLPRLRLFGRDEYEDEQLGALVPTYGSLALTVKGAEVLDVPRVEIDAFVPHGNVLAPGVLDADDEIRIGDEVYFEGEKARGVGRAKMFGDEMARSTRGVSVDVRHVEEVE
ncbi:archaeosine synthase subunit alpha [Halorutilales archaeon Cl-col2-1]